MEPILELGLEATRWLQENYPQLEGLMGVLRELGTEEFYLTFLPILYWCIHKRFATHLVTLFLISIGINAIAKHGFRGPRPLWLDPSLGLGGEDPQYGVPSNHVQSTAVIFLFAAAWIQRSWAWLVAFAVVFLMALSRVFLGDHFLHDVVAGFLFSLLCLLGYWVWQHRFAKNYNRRILGQRILYALLVPIGLAVFYALVLLIIGEADTSQYGNEIISQAEREGYDGVATVVGTLIGIAFGFPLEASRVRFRVEGAIWKRVLRYVLGIVVAGLIWGGLGAIFPDEPLWLAIPLRVFRYGLLTVWISYYAPWVFVRLSLADADPPAEISLKM